MPGPRCTRRLGAAPVDAFNVTMVSPAAAMQLVVLLLQAAPGVPQRPPPPPQTNASAIDGAGGVAAVRVAAHLLQQLGCFKAVASAPTKAARTGANATVRRYPRIPYPVVLGQGGWEDRLF